MSKWFVLFTYNRIYTVILLEKKKNFPNTPWSNCYSKYCVRPKGHTHPPDNTCTPASLCTVYQMYNLLALSYQNLKGALSLVYLPVHHSKRAVTLNQQVPVDLYKTVQGWTGNPPITCFSPRWSPYQMTLVKHHSTSEVLVSVVVFS